MVLVYYLSFFLFYSILYIFQFFAHKMYSNYYMLDIFLTTLVIHFHIHYIQILFLILPFFFSYHENFVLGNFVPGTFFPGQFCTRYILSHNIIFYLELQLLAFISFDFRLISCYYIYIDSSIF